MFLKEVKFYESYGFKILCQDDSKCSAETLKDQYSFKLDGPKSFSFEIVIILVIFILGYYFYYSQKLIEELLNRTSKEDIIKFKKLETEMKKV